jgi:hypothetical protein
MKLLATILILYSQLIAQWICCCSISVVNPVVPEKVSCSECCKKSNKDITPIKESPKCPCPKKATAESTLTIKPENRQAETVVSILSFFQLSFDTVIITKSKVTMPPKGTITYLLISEIKLKRHHNLLC